MSYKHWRSLAQTLLVLPRIDPPFAFGKIAHATKANLTKVRDAKPRVLASSATFERHEEPKIAGLPPPLNQFAICKEDFP